MRQSASGNRESSDRIAFAMASRQGTYRLSYPPISLRDLLWPGRTKCRRTGRAIKHLASQRTVRLALFEPRPKAWARRPLSLDKLAFTRNAFMRLALLMRYSGSFPPRSCLITSKTPPGTSRPLRYLIFRGSIPHPMQSLCTLRNHCCQRPRNARYQADATPYLGRTFTGRIAPALPGALTRSPRRRVRVAWGYVESRAPWRSSG